MRDPRHAVRAGPAGSRAALLWTGMCLFLAAGPALPRLQAEPLKVSAVVSQQEVFVGEAFRFELRVEGSENPAEPALPRFDGFSLRKLGGTRNSSTSMTLINGRMSQDVRRGYVYAYQLTPTRAGKLTIPAMTVRADKRTARSQPVTVTARKPAETEEMKLRLVLAKPRVYVGEPAVLTVTWYFAQNVEGFEFALPVLESDTFHVADIPPPAVRGAGRGHRFTVNGRETVARQGQTRLDGKEFATLTFAKVLIAKRAGRVRIEPATVLCEALVGYRKRNRSLFDDFGFGRRGVYKKLVVPSNELDIEVMPLPSAGRPANFAGHVGNYRLSAAAAPLEASVGDPITLTVTMRGPAYLDHLDLPPLHEQPALARDFKIPREMAPGKQEGRSKVFTQTVRANRAGIEQVPPIELPYFDTRTGGYKVARTQPMPITVNETRVVTAADAEGSGPVTSAGRALKAWSRGIAHNYEAPSVLNDSRHGPGEWGRSPAWLCLLAIPPCMYLSLLLATSWIRRRTADPLAAKARGASSEFGRSLRQAGHAFASDPGEGYAALLESLRVYLGSRLRTAGGALTYRDVERRLVDAGADGDCLRTLKGLFDRCEAGRYAGSLDQDGGTETLLHDAGQVVKELERVLK